MSKEEDNKAQDYKAQDYKTQANKAIVGRWFTDFWGKTCNLDIVDELAAPDMLLQYSLHDPRRGSRRHQGVHDRFPQGVSGPQLLGHNGLDRGRRLCRRSLGRRRHSHRAGVQRLPGRLAARRHGPQDALHRHDGVALEGGRVVEE